MQKTASITLLLAATIVFAGCTASSTESTAKKENSADSSKSSDGTTEKQSKPIPASIETTTLGNTKNVHRAGQLYFAGQFTQDDISVIKEANIKRVITLRTDGEIKWDEKAALKEIGLDLIEVPFRGPETLTDEVFDRIRELLKDDETLTLFHCGSANRVGGVWIPYRVLDEGVDLETAIKEAKEIGLRNEGYQKRAVEYIEKQGPSK